MNREEQRHMPGMPGEVFQRPHDVANGRPAPEVKTPTQPPPQKFTQNQALSCLGDLAEAEDLLGAVIEEVGVDEKLKPRLGLCLDRVIHVKNILLRSAVSRV